MIDKNYLALLGFDKLLEIISAGVHSDISRKAVLDIIPLEKKEEIETRFGQIENIRRLSQDDMPLELTGFYDILPLLLKVRPQGAVLEVFEISYFLPLLQMASEIPLRISEVSGLSHLKEITDQLHGNDQILKLIQKSIGSDGSIMDSASPALFHIRKELRRLETGIRKRLEEMTRESSLSVFLQDDFITKRAGRWVIPVRMDAKGQVSGVVHDISKSGETAFVEPIGIIHLSNELENLVADEKTEELRIMRHISSEIRSNAEEIEHEFRLIVKLDMLNCIAKFADRMNMNVPEVANSEGISLVNARHPLLSFSILNTGIGRAVVPLNLSLGGNQTVMVLTGSNAGGKTIAIKTVGLLLCMALSGMPVPADSSSYFPMIDDLLIDMGNEQSIERNLSTFSAHISQISSIVERADQKSLVLIDELGTGTNPEEGTAISCAVLKELRKSGSLVFATTHLVGIKGFVHRTPGMLNASMEFDQKTLTPLYRLRIGEPGQSHALDIAGKYGLSEAIIKSAREMLGGEKEDLDKLIADLNEKRAHYENILEELALREKEISSNEKMLKQRLSETAAKQREILADAYRESLEIIARTRSQMYAELDAIKNKDKQKVKEEIKNIGRIEKEVVERLSVYEVSHDLIPAPDGLKNGDVVYVKSLGFDAEVLEVIHKTGRVKVMAGSKEIEVPLSDIGMRQGKALLMSRKEAVIPADSDKTVPSRINLIGMRVDEALPLLEPFLNDASLIGFSEVTIIHGIGTGKLSKAVRSYLKGHALVNSFRTGEPSEGGAGVTVALIK